MKSIRYLYLAIVYGMMVGVCAGIVFVFIFPGIFVFTIFILKLGVDGFFIVVKSIPYALLEISVYFYGAYLALEIANNLDPYVKEKNLKLFVRESKKSIKDKRVWKILLVLYLLLF